ncbi:MAG: imidazoleglycerol-phosphate dehydratase HisB [Actinobacteria bacterium]|nr:imidazoleglycerol-phosphate dehydratase HisB [Actinomycetota bacterium]MCL6105500.1 imidazoleglycerol-phosphate dehydratase HisB [Actinomycetota bacterium]
MERQLRSVKVKRDTKETNVEVELCLDADATGSSELISTGLPFFDHMLSQLSKHGGFSLRLYVKGDLHVDAHHSVEDAGLALGEAFLKALSNKQGIRRFSSIAVPLDEALVEAALDISGRPYLHYELNMPPDLPPLGDPPFDPQLAEEFWRAFTTKAGISLHLQRVRGRNVHHVLEASFKAVARALHDAVRIENSSIPSTKGKL